VGVNASIRQTVVPAFRPLSLSMLLGLATRLDHADCIRFLWDSRCTYPDCQFEHQHRTSNRSTKTNNLHHRESSLTQLCRRINSILHLVLIVRRICHLKSSPVFRDRVMRRGPTTSQFYLFGLKRMGSHT
jgi:hypothetical protein